VKRLFSYAQDLSPSDNIESLLKQAAADADLDVADMSSPDGRAGTTAVAALVVGSAAYWLSVGDSRIYLLRDHEIFQITRDHNYELELKFARDAGETISEAMKAERPDALISYLGMGGLTLADTGKINLKSEDSLLLCSDGLFKTLTDREIAQMLDSFGSNVAGCADALATSAISRGGARQDNTTVVVIRTVA
jgi:protein phosphatase